MQAALQSRGMGYQGPLFELRRYSRPESGRGEAMTDGKLRKTVYGRRSRFDVLEVHSPVHAPRYVVHKNGELHGGLYPDLRAAVFAAREDAWREYWAPARSDEQRTPSSGRLPPGVVRGRQGVGVGGLKECLPMTVGGGHRHSDGGCPIRTRVCNGNR